MLVTIRDEVVFNIASGEGRVEPLQEKVKELRQRMGRAQEDMAREIGVSLSTVQRWERQGGEPTRLARRELKRLFKEVGIEDDLSS